MNQVIAKDEKGLKYLSVNLPASWKATIASRPVYGGYGYPFRFNLTALSSDNRQKVQYFSPLNYQQDYLNNYRENTFDNYGSLHRSFMRVEDFLDLSAKSIYGKFENFQFGTQVVSIFAPQADYADLTLKKFNEIKERYAQQNPDRVLNSYYYYGATRIYTYVYKGTHRTVAFSALIEAEESTDYFETPIPSSLLNDPLSMGLVNIVFPGLFRDSQGRYMSLGNHSTYWKVLNRTLCDATETDFDELYNGVYRDFCLGISWQDDLKKELNRQQQQINEKNRLQREDARKASEIYHQMEMDRIKAAKQRSDINRETSNQISQIQRSAYENRQKALDKANRQFSDSFLGNQRYADQYGDEHLVHSTNRYAFKKGNKIVTTDNPRGPGFGWEELKKKD